MAATFVTADHCKGWEKSGRNEFLKFCRAHADRSGLVSLGNHDFRQAVYEVCLHVVQGHLKIEQAISALSEVQEQQSDVASLVTDILGMIDVELTCIEDDKSQRERLNSLVGAVSQSFVADAVLKSRLDLDTLENGGLVPSKQTFQQKYVKIKTRLYYKQQKFNLLREESEGYSKLITELNQDIPEALTPERMLQNIKSLIGCFNLDPNRVIDVLLESFELRPEMEGFYAPLIRSYVSEKQTLCHVLGFKFQFYKDDETPASLYRVAALLLKNELIDLDGLYPHLSPSDSSIVDYSKKEMSDAKQYARKLTVVSLADKSNDDKKEEETVKVDPHQNNQKLGLCEALLHIGTWEKAKCILDRMPEFFGTTYKPIATSLCKLIHTVMDPVYKQNNGIPGDLRNRRKGKQEQTDGTVQTAQTFRDIHTLVFPMVTYLGPHASVDPILLVKLMRLGRCYMTKRQTGSLTPEDGIMYYGLLSILDEVLIPSLSFLTCNCCIAEELWSLVKLFPYELRYRMYGNWKNDAYMTHPRMIKLRADCLEKAKYIMKRLSKENVKPSGRQLGKLSHSNPGVLFEYVLIQIQKYDNLIGPVVDSLKYLTNLSYDILIFCIIEAVANPEREKMKHDDTNLSLWLQSLANFAGSICKKYQVELAGILQYVANTLKAGKSFDLLLMREVVQKMAGIEISEEITSDQLEAMSGGELLKQEGGYFAQVRNTKKSSTRLKETLLEHDLALSLCLLIAQQRDSVIYKEGAAGHLKLLGKLYDQCQDTLVQFGSFLSMQLSMEEFVKGLPSIEKLVSEYHVPADAAFFLSRARYSYEINAKYEELRKIDKAAKTSSQSTKTQRYTEAAEHVMNPVVECIRPLQSPKIWEDLSPTFYVTFWSLSVYDISVPSGAYEKQIQQINSQIHAIDENKDMAQSKRKKEKDRCNQLIDKLKDEEKKQSEHVQRVMARLKNEKESWFVSRSTKNETITQFLQLCIFPRCCFTASDTAFCAKFIHILHNLKTPNFSTLICYDRIFCDITYTVSSCTENEAHRYGRFLCAALETIMKWHSDKACYDKDCGNYPGFVTVFRKGIDSNNKADQLDFENFRHVCHKWHFRITKAMVSCLESGKYIQIRNALIILTKMLAHYPRIIQFGQALERRVERLKQDEKEKRPDIYALAMGYSGQLKSKKSTWVPETSFHNRDKDATKNAAKVNGPTSQAGSKGDASTTKGTAKKMTNGDAKPVAREKDGKETKESKSRKMEKAEKPSGDKEGRLEEKVKTSVSENKKPPAELERKESNTNMKVSSRDKEKASKIKEEPMEEKERVRSSDKEKSREEKAERTPREERSSKEKIEKSLKSKEEKSREKEERREAKMKEERHEVKVKEEKMPKEHRDKSSREEMKVAEKREKEAKKDEKHERIKLKRSYSPAEREEREREREAKERDREEERAVSVTSNSSSGHRSHPKSPDVSPRHMDERDVKRRKTDITPSTSKEDARGSSKSRHRQSLSPDREKEREKKEKKRDHLGSDSEAAVSSSKKRRSIDNPGRSSRNAMNGESSDDRVRTKEDRHYYEDIPSKSSSSRKEADEGTPDSHRSRSREREKKKDKEKSSSKRQKKS